MMTPKSALNFQENIRGNRMAHIKNARLLEPITTTGQWRKFVTNTDDYSRIIVRTVRFIGVENNVACFAPDDLYIWEENEA